MIVEGKYATFFLLLKFTLGLANSVPGSQKGALFNAASIFVVVESRKYPESYAGLKKLSYLPLRINVRYCLLSSSWLNFYGKKKCRFTQK